MMAHPKSIAGEGHLATDLMPLTDDRIVADLLAEGLLGVAAPDRHHGVAISDADGSQRSLGPATVDNLEQLGLADAATPISLREQHIGLVPSFADEPTSDIQPVLDLDQF